MLMLRTLSAWPKLSDTARQKVVEYYTPSAPVSGSTATGVDREVIRKLGLQGLFFDALLTTEHFALYYVTTAGSIRTATQAYVEQLAQALERARAEETATLGFNPPPASHGDGVRYEVYVIYIDTEKIASGMVVPNVLDSTSGRSLMFISNGVPPANLTDLAFHEFNHASQYTYPPISELILLGDTYWYMEATAQWVQFALNPGSTASNNWSSLVSEYLEAPEPGFYSYALWEPDRAKYGTVLFPKFLAERYGANFSGRPGRAYGTRVFLPSQAEPSIPC